MNSINKPQESINRDNTKNHQDELKVKVDNEIRIKEKKCYKDYQFWIAIFSLIVSIAAIVVSITIALDLYSSFNLIIHSNGAYIYPMGFNNQNDTSIAFFIPISFINTGAREGIIEDIKLVITKGSLSVNYTALEEIDLSLLNKKESWNEMDYFQQPFSGFVITGKNSLFKTIYFTLENLKEGSYFLYLQEGNYKLDILVKTHKIEHYEKKESFTIKINQKAIDNFKKRNRVFLRRDGKQIYAQYNISK
ncbi:hypothetical protein GF358_01630 [Candidatus Woesearchaeota archaeon]|nr:hypothetical protein [Candidatus Woesearchaeota archaeon]